jgi:hypothetical protein
MWKRGIRTIVVLLAVMVHCGHSVAQEGNVDQLLAQEERPIQEQIDRVVAALQQPGAVPRSNIAAIQEIQKLKDIVVDKFEIVKQIAIFAAQPGEGQPLFARVILELLDLPPKIVIRTLAPYLDADNKNLRSFVRDWFQALDNAGSDLSALEEVHYEDYLDYVRGQKI